MQSLCVENLPAGTTVPELVTLFKPFGWVAGVDLRAGTNSAVGAVDLAWGGDLAVRHLHGAEFRGQVLVVRGPGGAARKC
jgi:hypothetical protein